MNDDRPKHKPDKPSTHRPSSPRPGAGKYEDRGSGGRDSGRPPRPGKPDRPERQRDNSERPARRGDSSRRPPREDRQDRRPGRDRERTSSYDAPPHRRRDSIPPPPAQQPRKRKRVGLPIRGRRPEAPAWIGRLDHPFKLDPQRVAELVELLDVTSSPEPFYQHLELVSTINEEVNLVSRANVDAVLLQSLWESLVPARDSDWRRGPKVLDLGTGGGFPGLPLALALHDLKMTLLDSRRAKTLSLQRMVGELNANNVSVVHDRAETHAERVETPYDSILVRAVSVLPEVAGWCEGLLKPGGTLLSWKGPEGEREVKGLDPDHWQLLYALPVLPHRYVLVVERKGSETASSQSGQKTA